LRLTSTFLPAVYLRRPDGTQLAGCATDNGIAGDWKSESVLDRDGPHAFYITDRNLNQTGTYTFSLLRVNPPTTAQPLAYGDVKTCSHDPLVKIDVWSSSPARRSSVLLRLTSTFLPAVYLRRPEGRNWRAARP